MLDAAGRVLNTAFIGDINKIAEPEQKAKPRTGRFLITYYRYKKAATKLIVAA